MNANDAAGKVLAVLVSEVDVINGWLDGVWTLLGTDAGLATDDTSPYRYFKVGDRDILPADAISVCVIPTGDRLVTAIGPNTVEREVSLLVVGYVLGCNDPQAREKVRGLLAEWFRNVLNRVGNRSLDTIGDGNSADTVYDCRLVDMQFGYSYRTTSGPKAGQVAAGVQATWRGLYYVTEDSNGG